jgi:hypothetical protein
MFITASHLRRLVLIENSNQTMGVPPLFAEHGVSHARSVGVGLRAQKVQSISLRVPAYPE